MKIVTSRGAGPGCGRVAVIHTIHGKFSIQNVLKIKSSLHRDSCQRMDIASSSFVHFKTAGRKQIVPDAGFGGRLVYSTDGKRRRLRVQSYHRPSVEKV